MNKTDNQAMLFIGLACLPILLAIAYFLGKQSNQAPVLTQVPTASATPSLAPSPEFSPLASTEPQPVVAIVVQETPKATARPIVTQIAVEPHSDWPLYTDSVARFSLRYDPNLKIIDQKPGEYVYFEGFRVVIYNDYTGGSRREWFKTKVDTSSYDVTYEDHNVDGANALIIKASDPGSTGQTHVMVARGKRVYLFTKDSGAESNDAVKEIVSTFKFL